MDPPMERERESDLARQLARLQDRIERDYVSIGEVSVWLVGVVLVLIAMHLVFQYWGYDYFRSRTDVSELPPVIQPKPNATVWLGRYADGGYAVMRIPFDSPEVGTFRDKALGEVLGRPVRSYWLSFFAFGAKTPPLQLTWEPGRATATVAGKTLQSLGLPGGAGLPAAVRIQLESMTAPLALQPSSQTRCLLLLPEHDPASLERVELRGPGGPLVLTRAQRSTQSLLGFLQAPSAAFFESAHAGDAATTPKK